MEIRNSVAGNVEVRVQTKQAKDKSRNKSLAWMHTEQKQGKEVELVTFPRITPAPSRDELIDLASAYNSSLGW